MLGCNSQAQDLQAHYLVPTFPVSWEEELEITWRLSYHWNSCLVGKRLSPVLHLFILQFCGAILPVCPSLLIP